MSLLTLEDLAVALGREIETAEEPSFQWLIESISVFIEDYTGMAFSLHEDETIRYRADGRGIVKLRGPVGEVATVTPVLSTDPYAYHDGYGPYYDGFDEIYYMPPFGIVDVTYTYGMEEVPQDIKHAAVEAIQGRIEGTDNGTLDTYTVGDVTERFKQPWGYESFGQMAQMVLDSYRGVGMSWRL
jgi:hypothetical protein